MCYEGDMLPNQSREFCIAVAEQMHASTSKGTRVTSALAIAILIGLIAGCAAEKSTAPKMAEPAKKHDHASAQTGHDHADDAHANGSKHGSSKHADHFEHRFEKADEWAKRFDEPGRDAWQKPDQVVELLDIKPGMIVADIGAGTGYFLAPFSKAVGDSGRVLGLDVEADMVRYMKERAKREGLGNVSARLVNPSDPEFEPNSVDRIVIVNTWHHIADRRSYTTKLVAALKPGGTIAVIDYTIDSPRGPPAKHRLTAENVVAELGNGGAKARVLAEDLPLQYIVVANQ